jgi:hypothetical protein
MEKAQDEHDMEDEARRHSNLQVHQQCMIRPVVLYVIETWKDSL